MKTLLERIEEFEKLSARSGGGKKTRRKREVTIEIPEPGYWYTGTV